MSLKEIKHKISVWLNFKRQYNHWQQITPIDYKSDAKHLAVIPCDPWSVGGSRGDEAMIFAIIQKFRALYPDAPISIVSADKNGENYIKNLPFPNVLCSFSWQGKWPIYNIYTDLLDNKVSDVILLGADCMDGFYSPFVSLTLLALHSLFSRTKGVNSHLMGYSFNNRPYRPICKAFNNLDGNVCINLRDPISLQRFKKHTHADAGLVADVAFLLVPDSNFDGYAKLRKWIDLRHQAGGQYVIGFNFHPMLQKYENTKGVKKDALNMAIILADILHRNQNIHFVLIPHDDRSKLTDNLMLDTISNELTRIGLAERFYYDPKVYRASQIKAICGLIDGLVSSRMHLAIAALGQGKSIMATTYQGKFEGLFQHFDLPQDYLMAPKDFISHNMVDCFFKYVDHLPQLTLKVQNKLNQVIELSNKNFA